jgi:ribosomal protein S18 acetylase RimI-like enzyme
MKPLQNLEKSDVIPAIEEFIFDLYKLFSNSPKMEVFSSEEMIWSLTDVPFFLFNMVFRSSFKAVEEEEAEEAIKKMIAKCQSRNVPLMWQIGPNAQPAELGSLLEKYGFSLADKVPGMAIEIHEMKNIPPIPQGFEIKRVSDETMLKNYLEVVKEVFKMPDFVIQTMMELFSFVGFEEILPIQHFLGYLNDEPVATCGLILGAGVAGILDIATLSTARCQGIGTFMTAYPLQYVKKRGYNIGVLTSTEEGVNVYKNLGFEEVCKINRYIWSPQALE